VSGPTILDEAGVCVCVGGNVAEAFTPGVLVSTYVFSPAWRAASPGAFVASGEVGESDAD